MVTFLKIKSLNGEVLHGIYNFNKLKYSCDIEDVGTMEFELNISSPDIPFLKTNGIFNRIELISQEGEKVLFSGFVKGYKGTAETLKVFCQQEKGFLDFRRIESTQSFSSLDSVLNASGFKYLIKSNKSFNALEFDFGTTFLTILNEVAETLGMYFKMEDQVIHFYDFGKDFSESKVAILDMESTEENNIVDLEIDSGDAFSKLYAKSGDNSVIVGTGDVHGFQTFDSVDGVGLQAQALEYLNTLGKGSDLINFGILDENFSDVKPGDQIFVKINLNGSIFDLQGKVSIMKTSVNFSKGKPEISIGIAEDRIKIQNTRNFFTTVRKDINKLLKK